MKQGKVCHRVSLFVLLGLLTAFSAGPAAGAKLIQHVQRPPRLLVIPGSNDHWLGLTIKDVNEATAKELELPGNYGAIVVAVIKGSPAEKAGFQPNDVILEYASWRVWSTAQLQRLVRETPPGRTVSIQVSRKGKLQTLQVKVENRGPRAFQQMPSHPEGPWVWKWPFYESPSTPRQYPFLEPGPKGKILPIPPAIPKFKHGPIPNPEVPGAPHLWIFPKPGPKGEARPFLNPRPEQENALGISGQNLTPQLANYFGVKEGKGVLVSQVTPKSPASAAGLKAGDVIVRVGTQEIGSMAELQRALQSQKNEKRRVALRIVRNRQEREMSVILIPGLHGARPEPIMSLR